MDNGLGLGHYHHQQQTPVSFYQAPTNPPPRQKSISIERQLQEAKQIMESRGQYTPGNPPVVAPSVRQYVQAPPSQYGAPQQPTQVPYVQVPATQSQQPVLQPQQPLPQEQQPVLQPQQRQQHTPQPQPQQPVIQPQQQQPVLQPQQQQSVPQPQPQPVPQTQPQQHVAQSQQQQPVPPPQQPQQKPSHAQFDIDHAEAGQAGEVAEEPLLLPPKKPGLFGKFLAGKPRKVRLGLGIAMLVGFIAIIIGVLCKCGFLGKIPLFGGSKGRGGPDGAEQAGRGGGGGLFKKKGGGRGKKNAHQHVVETGGSNGPAAWEGLQNGRLVNPAPGEMSQEQAARLLAAQQQQAQQQGQPTPHPSQQAQHPNQQPQPQVPSQPQHQVPPQLQPQQPPQPAHQVAPQPQQSAQQPQPYSVSIAESGNPALIAAQQQRAYAQHQQMMQRTQQNLQQQNVPIRMTTGGVIAPQQRHVGAYSADGSARANIVSAATGGAKTSPGASVASPLPPSARPTSDLSYPMA